MGCSNRKAEKIEPVVPITKPELVAPAPDIIQQRQAAIKQSHDPAAHKALEEQRRTARFNWRSLPVQKIQVVQCGFNYVFDHAENAFRLRNDGSTYTIAELQWSYLVDYEVYNFTYKDLRTVDTETMKETPAVDPIVYSFDVSVDGKFVRSIIPELIAWHS